MNKDVEVESFGLTSVENLFAFPFVKNNIQLIPYEFAKQHKALPIDEKKETLLVAISDPFAFEALEEIRLLTGKEVREIIAPEDQIIAAIEMCYHQSEAEKAQLFDSIQAEENDSSLEEGYELLSQKRSGSLAVQMLNAILQEAIQQGASDIHFEPLESSFSVRYRIDGVLQLRHAPPKEYQSQILTRIKVMACMDIAEQRLPQDGRIKLKLGSKQIDFRVSTIPIVHGERVVLRILDKSNVLLGLDKIGMRPKVLEQFNHLIRMSEGIVLVTGPTGSGKTTTLYSALTQINSSQINIMTIEDPVEYKLQKMAQIGVNPKINLTFATGLRHILRQDPDVIMIGEIRDRETAEIAIQAALTGHLVLCTLHTNDAPSALTRLVDMGIETYLLSSSVVGVLAQRLVRSICPHCKERYEPTEKELSELGIQRVSTDSLSSSELPLFFGSSFEEKNSTSSNTSNLQTLSQAETFFIGAGCDQCYGTGYKGRLGIYELMPMTGRIKRQLIETPDSALLQKVALEEGLETLRQDGGRLVAAGCTTAAEVFRVTRGIE